MDGLGGWGHVSAFSITLGSCLRLGVGLDGQGCGHAASQTPSAATAPSAPGTVRYELPVEPEKPAEPITCTSSTHRKEWAVLSRLPGGKKESEFPEIARVFASSNHSEKLSILKMFVESGGDLQKCESSWTFSRKQREKTNKNRQCLTIAEMIKAGCSKSFA